MAVNGLTASLDDKKKMQYWNEWLSSSGRPRIVYSFLSIVLVVAGIEYNNKE